MKIFPAIDIKDKKCVRLVKGDFENKIEYEMSPVEQAEKYKDHGFINLHIVDLDGALTGETVNLNIIEEIVNKFDLKIEIGIEPVSLAWKAKVLPLYDARNIINKVTIESLFVNKLHYK